MEKLTDEEIIRGAECCKDISQCKDCPYNDTTNCVVNLINDIYDLTNRQNAEMERLLKQLKEGIDLSDFVIRDVKTVAIKEFADKVKLILREMFDLMIDDDEGKCIIKNCKKHSSIPCMNEYCIKENREAWETKIDNLVKEMAGESDGKNN